MSDLSEFGVSTKRSEMSAGFLRQRRNVLLISILMPLFVLSGAQVEKINLLGTVIQVDDSRVILWGIFMFFVYALWRYWQYYEAEGFGLALRSAYRKYNHKAELAYYQERIKSRIQVFEPKTVYSEFSRIRKPYTQPQENTR